MESISAFAERRKRMRPDETAPTPEPVNKKAKKVDEEVCFVLLYGLLFFYHSLKLIQRLKVYQVSYQLK